MASDRTALPKAGDPGPDLLLVMLNGKQRSARKSAGDSLESTVGYLTTHAPLHQQPMKYKTVKAVRIELERRGGYLETIRDTELPEYAPHLSRQEQGWEHGLWIKDELLAWALEHLNAA